LKLLHGLRISFNGMSAFDKLMGARDRESQFHCDTEPVQPRLVSLRSVASNLNTALADISILIDQPKSGQNGGC